MNPACSYLLYLLHACLYYRCKLPRHGHDLRYGTICFPHNSVGPRKLTARGPPSLSGRDLRSRNGKLHPVHLGQLLQRGVSSTVFECNLRRTTGPASVSSVAYVIALTTEAHYRDTKQWITKFNPLCSVLVCKFAPLTLSCTQVSRFLLTWICLSDGHSGISRAVPRTEVVT